MIFDSKNLTEARATGRFLDRVFRIHFRYSTKAYQNRIGLMEAQFFRSEIAFIHSFFSQTEVFRVVKDPKDVTESGMANPHFP